MPHILLLSGSLRAGSSNETMLRTVAEVASADLGDADVTTTLYPGLGGLPHFNPDEDTDPLPAPVAELRAAIASADALLICTPEYAGTLPGSFKNLLDWTVGGTEIGGKPTAWINAANHGRGGGAEATLRMVLDYTDAAVVEEACAAIPFERDVVGADGVIVDAEIRGRIADVARRLIAAL